MTAQPPLNPEALRDLYEACKEALTAINNLVTGGHESLILRKHPAPCNRLDFCVVSDAMRRYGVIDAAINKAENR
jgi:hypothetical protein